MKTIGVDVGGTFTDLVFCDMDNRRSRHPQGFDHSAGPLARAS